MPTPTHDPVTVVPIGPERRADVLRLDQAAFVGGDLGDDTGLEFFEWDRTAGVVTEDDELIGLGSAYSLGVRVPDGANGVRTRRVPMAGLTWVGVHPGHRRRGILRAMIRHHLHGLHDSGAEAVSGLHASEAAIYGRFGYGLASTGLRLVLPRGAALRPVEGADEVAVRFETADAQAHTELVEGLYEQACAQRPGTVSRPPALGRRGLQDPPWRRRRGEPLRLLIAERSGTPTGYAVLRRAGTWSDGTPDGTTDVHELTALDAPTAHALWSRVCDFDLMSRTRTPSLPADDRLLVLLVDARSTRPTRADDLWVRLVDVDRALAGRTYGQDVDVVLAVTDELCPWNARTWRLSGGPDGATCSQTTQPADISLDVRELGAVYVGGTTLAGLSAAGLVREHSPGAVAQLSSALRGTLEASSAFPF